MRGVRFKSLSIAAFRGISDPVVFDLSAPLTLVFAPNGSGKTTMCEAAEWLLTGQVERLKEGKNFDAKVLRSRFSDGGSMPSAAADLLLGGEPRFLRRGVEGSQSPAVFGFNSASAAKCGPHDLLSRLAPAAAANEAHHLTAINLRQRWLRGTRFLSAEALAALVDSDEETIERRTQVFADLLGIRHLLDAERQCERYSAELATRLRGVEQLTNQQSAEANALEEELAQETPPGSTRVSARSEIAAAITLLDADDLRGSADSSIDERLTAVTAIHRRLRHALDDRIAAMRRIESQWPARASLEQAVADATTLEGQLTQALAGIEEKGRAAAALLAEQTTAREIATEAARALTSSKDRLTKLCTALVALLHDAGLLTPGPQTLAALADRIPESEWTAGARDLRRRALSSLRTALEHAGGEIERLRLLNAELARLRPQLVSEEALAVLRRDAGDAETRARTAQSLLDALAAPAARLQIAARDLLAHDHGIGASECPACAHDWGNAARLRAAIAATVGAGPQIAKLAQSNATAAIEAASATSARLSAAVAARTQVEALEHEHTSLTLNADRRQRDLQQLGLNADRPFNAIAAALLRLDIADALAALVEVRDKVTPTLPGGSAPLLPAETPLPNLLDQLETTFGARDQVVRLQLAELVKLIEQASEARDRLRVEHAATQQRLRECRTTLQDNNAELATLRQHWDAAAPNTQWSDTALARLKEELARLRQRLANAEAHIEAARGAWASETRRNRLAALRQAILPSLNQQQRMSGQIEVADRARAGFHDTYTNISRNQVLALSRVVNPLFARMHANRVFDRINLGEGADFLHWLADAGGEQLDPGKDFSQGQRQDLALALFLARARSLGGTFFLDEPVIHLDDLNRVGLLDILRATVLEGSDSLNLVITTSSRSLARHLIEKFAAIGTVPTPFGALHPLRVIELDGNGRTGVQLASVYPL